jgi:hypothetical protein
MPITEFPPFPIADQDIEKVDREIRSSEQPPRDMTCSLKVDQGSSKCDPPAELVLKDYSDSFDKIRSMKWECIRYSYGYPSDRRQHGLEDNLTCAKVQTYIEGGK